MSKKRVFLGGTCNGSLWRDRIIKDLKVDYFNPVVPDWNEAAYQQELKEREECDICLYYITPMMTGVYSIAEAIDDSNKRPEKTVFYYDVEDTNKVMDNEKFIGEFKLDFNKAQIKSLEATGRMVEKNGGKWAKSYIQLVNILNE